MLNNKEYLHVTSSASSAGALKVALNKGVKITCVELNLAIPNVKITTKII